MEKKEKREDRVFIGTVILLMLVLTLHFYGGSAVKINTTMLAFSYKYGFISRGLIGTIFHAINSLTSVDMISYVWALRFFQASSLVYDLLLLLFIITCMKHVPRRAANAQKILILFFVIFAATMFVSEYNLGRLDVYCMMVSLLAVMLLVTRHAEWLVVPLSMMGVMCHQGYVFMFYGMIMALLVYRIFSEQGQSRRKYIAILVVSFCAVSVLFLWFELLSHHYATKGEYSHIVEAAKALGPDGKYHKDVIDHEILGVNLNDRETRYQMYNRVQFPMFVILMLPYIVIGVRFFAGLIRSAENKAEKIRYWFAVIGAATILPDMLLKVDYGRWMFSILAYYCIVVISLMAMGDAKTIQAADATLAGIRRHPAAVLLLIYPVLLVPFGDVNICPITNYLGQFVNAHFLHLWKTLPWEQRTLDLGVIQAMLQQ